MFRITKHKQMCVDVISCTSIYIKSYYQFDLLLLGNTLSAEMFTKTHETIGFSDSDSDGEKLLYFNLQTFFFHTL